MLKSLAKLGSSEITTQTAQAAAVGVLIGQRLGRTGSCVAQTSETGLPRVPAVAAQEVSSDPEIIDREESLGPLRIYITNRRWRNLTTDRHGWDGYVSNFEVAANIPADAVDEARMRWKAFQRLCAPLDGDDLLRELTRLMVNCARRETEDMDTRIILDTWRRDLADYPADIVLWAFGFWRRNERFWPTWCEFKALLDRRVAQRRAIMAALEEIGRKAAAAIEDKRGEIDAGFRRD